MREQEQAQHGGLHQLRTEAERPELVQTKGCDCKGQDGHPKVRYYTRKDARMARKAMRGRGAYSGNPIRPYRCPGNPTLFHLTSSPTGSVTYYRDRGNSL